MGIFSICISIHEVLSKPRKDDVGLPHVPGQAFRDALCTSIYDLPRYTYLSKRYLGRYPHRDPKGTRRLRAFPGRMGQSHHDNAHWHQRRRHWARPSPHFIYPPLYIPESPYSMLHRIHTAVDGTTITSRASPIKEVDRGRGFVWGIRGTPISQET